MNESTKHLSKIANRSHFGGKRTAVPPVSLLYMAVTAALMSSNAQAKVATASENTGVIVAANGVEVIDIATANGAGVSHNVFNRYDVDAAGQVLNNNASSGAVQSQLAGSIAANANLGTQAASLIINEVAGDQRSALNGQLEVAGSRADVVIANPNGITCSGCGFINVGRTTLTTGAVELDSNSGVLKTLHVEGGDISVTGQGIRVDNDVAMDLISRQIKLDASVSAGTVDMVAGRNDVDYATLEAQTLASDQSRGPKLAIDSTSLGGIFANKIHLISTESGIGVKMEGDAAANTGEFTLIANGDIKLKNTIRAGGNITVDTKNWQDSVSFTGGGVHSDGDIAITAGGNISSTGTAFTATGNASLQAGLDLSIGARSTTSNNSGTYSSTDYEGYDSAGYYTHTSTVLQGSSINVGGNLNLSSGWATTITASELAAAGVATVNSGTHFSLLAGYDKDVLNTYEVSQGLFMGGGLYGFRLHTATTESTTARSASLVGQAGAQITANTALTVVGSSTNANLNSGWSQSLLSADNKFTYNDNVTTISFLTSGAYSNLFGSLSLGSSLWSNGLGIAGDSNYILSYAAGAELNLIDVTSVDTSHIAHIAVASKVNSAGDLYLTSAGEITLSGAQIGAGGNLHVSGRSVTMQAATNSIEDTTVNTRTRFGLSGDVGVGTSGELNLNLDAMLGIAPKPGDAYKDTLVASMDLLKTGFSVRQNNSISTDLALGVKYNKTTTSHALTNHAESVLTAGNNIDLNAGIFATLAGAELFAGDRLSVTAPEIISTAVYDEIKDSTKADYLILGPHFSAGASADQSAGLGLPTLSEGLVFSVGPSAGLDYEVGAELNLVDIASVSAGQTVHNAVASKLISKGDVVLTSPGEITLSGTQVEAGNNLHISGRNVTMLVATNSTENTTESTRTRFGLSGNAEATAAWEGLSLDFGSLFGLDPETGEMRIENLLTWTPTLEIDLPLKLEDTGISGELTLGLKYDKTAASHVVNNHFDSVLNAGNNIDLNAGYLATLAGADLNARNKINLNAGYVATLAGADLHAGDRLNLTAGQIINSTVIYDEIKDTKEVKSIIIGPHLVVATSGADAYSFGPHLWSEGLGVSVGPSASVGYGIGAELNLVDITSVDTSRTVRNAVGSELTSAGDVFLTTGGEVTLSGARIDAGGNLGILGRNVSVLAATNSNESSTSNTHTRFGLFGDFRAANTTGLSFDLGMLLGTDEKSKEKYQDTLMATMATLKAGLALTLDTSIAAELLLGVKRDQSTVSRLMTNHVDSVLSASNDIDLNAGYIATLAGAEMRAGNNLNVTAGQINSLAVHDEIKDSITVDSHVGGLYISGQASASSNARVGPFVDISLSNLNAFAGVEASTSLYAGIEAGIRYGFNRVEATEDKLSAFGNTLFAGGNIERIASVGIYDEGTQATAGGNIIQQAGVITDTYASNSQTTTETSQSHDVRLAFVAEAGIDFYALIGFVSDFKKIEELSKQLEQSPVYKNVGIEASYKGNFNYGEEKATQAVVSRYDAGGSFTSQATGGQLNMHGTEINANGSVLLNSSLGVNYGAAQDTFLKKYGGASVSGSAFYDVIDQLPKLIKLIGNISAGKLIAVVDVVSQIPTFEGSFSNTDTYTYSRKNIGGSINAGSVDIHGGAFANLSGTHIQSDDNIDISALSVSVLPGVQVNLSGGLTAAGSFSFSTVGKGGSKAVKDILSLLGMPSWIDASISGYVLPTNWWLSGQLTDIAELNAKGKVDLSGFLVITPLAIINSYYNQLNPSPAAITFRSIESTLEDESTVDEADV